MTPTGDLVGAVDIGGTKIAVGLVDGSGAILEQAVAPTQREAGFDVGLATIQRLLDECLERLPGVHLLGVGVGCTGPVDPITGVLGPNSFMPLWEGVRTLEVMQAALGVPVAIENDADAAALGEAAWGAGQGASRCIYGTVSTGIGCGIVIDGRLYRGAGGAHPELGHMVIDASEGTLCYCGARGCWESLASGTALAAWYGQQRRERGLAEAQDERVDARAICARATDGEALAQEAVLREGYYLGIGLANLITAFVPDVIVLGGGVMESWSLFEGQAQAVIRQTCGLVPYERTRILRAALGAAALGGATGLVGAARVWFHHMQGAQPAA